MDFLSNLNLKSVGALATPATKVLVVDGADNTIKTNTVGQIVSGADGDKGDIVVSGSGSIWTIENDAVTYAKMQNVSATGKVLGRSSLGPGNVEEIDCTAAGRAIIGAADAASQRTILELVSIATTGSATDLGTGTVPAARFPALTGDVTSSAATVNTTIAPNAVTTTKIANSNVTYAKIQNVTASKILGRKTNSIGDVEECSLSEVLDLVGSAAQGDILYRGATGWTRLGAGTSGQYLKTQGGAANPVWADVTSGTGRSFSILTAQDAGWAISSIPTGNTPGTPIPIDGNGIRRYVIGFKPTNVRLSFWQITVGDNNFGFRVQISTSPSDWSTAVVSDIVYASYNAPADVIRTGSSTLSLPGSAPYYFRFLAYNNSGGTQSQSIKDLTVEFWS